jgi:hypothetical protein
MGMREAINQRPGQMLTRIFGQGIAEVGQRPAAPGTIPFAAYRVRAPPERFLRKRMAQALRPALLLASFFSKSFACNQHGSEALLVMAYQNTQQREKYHRLYPVALITYRLRAHTLPHLGWMEPSPFDLFEPTVVKLADFAGSNQNPGSNRQNGGHIVTTGINQLPIYGV